MESNNVVQLKIGDLQQDSPIRLKHEIAALEAELLSKRAETDFYKLKCDAIIHRYTAMVEMVSMMVLHEPNEITENGNTFLEEWRKAARNMIIL